MQPRKGERVRALLRYTKGFRIPILLSFLLMAVELILGFISPLVLSVTIDSVLDTKPVNVAWYFSWFVPAVGGVEVIRRNLWIMAAAMLGMTLLSGLVRFARARLNTRSGEGSVRRLRDRLYAHIQRLPFRWHAAAQTGDVIQRATTDVDTIRRFLSGMLLEFVRTLLMVLVGAAVMFTINTTLAMITIGMVIPVAVVSILFHLRIDKLFTVQEEAEGRLFTVMQENVTGIRVVRAFGRSGFELDRFNAANEETRKQLLRGPCWISSAAWSSPPSSSWAFSWRWEGISPSASSRCSSATSIRSSGLSGASGGCSASSAAPLSPPDDWKRSSGRRKNRIWKTAAPPPSGGISTSGT